MTNQSEPSLPAPNEAPLTEDAAAVRGEVVYSLTWNEHWDACPAHKDRVRNKGACTCGVVDEANAVLDRYESAIRASRPTLTDEPAYGATNTEQWVGASRPPLTDSLSPSPHVTLLTETPHIHIHYFTDDEAVEKQGWGYAHFVCHGCRHATGIVYANPAGGYVRDLTGHPELFQKRGEFVATHHGHQPTLGSDCDGSLEAYTLDSDLYMNIDGLGGPVPTWRELLGAVAAVRAESRPATDDERAGWNADLLNASNELEKAQERILDLENELAESRPDAALLGEALGLRSARQNDPETEGT